MERLKDNVINLPGEIWKPVMVLNGHFKDAYEISNLGRLKSFYSKKDILVKPSGDKRLYVKLSYNGVSKGFLLAYLVLMTFNPTKITDRNQIIYKDGNVQNITLSNLEWTKKCYENLEGEVWKHIPGPGDYYASNLGRIRKGLWLMPQKSNKEGSYLCVNSKLGNNVARLVASAFLSKENYDKSIWNELTINHIDGNKQNNRIENLEWCTIKENVRHAYRTGLNPVTHPIYMECNDFIFKFFTKSEIFEVINIDLTPCQLHSYINSGRLYKNQYLFFDNNYIPFTSKIPDLENEVWKELKGHEHEYLISNKGRLKHICFNQKENLSDPKNVKLITGKSIYQIMAEYFANKELKFFYPKDGNRKNYSMDNLLFNEIENLEGEEWKFISTIWINDKLPDKQFKRLSEYQISSYGRICYVRNFQMHISYGSMRKGTLMLRFRFDDKEYGLSIDRLMCLTFMNINCNSYEECIRHHVIHLDNNKHNNHLNNLKWI